MDRSFEIYKYVTIYVILPFLAIMPICILAIYLYDRHKVKKLLASLQSKGYKWATEPSGCLHVYIQAKKESVKCIGRLPNNRMVYETDSGKKFYSDDEIASAAIDIAGHVHITEMDNVAVEGADLIIPEGWYVIRDSSEFHDFEAFTLELKNSVFTILPEFANWNFDWNTTIIDHL